MVLRITSGRRATGRGLRSAGMRGRGRSSERRTDYDSWPRAVPKITGPTLGFRKREGGLQPPNSLRSCPKIPESPMPTSSTSSPTSQVQSPEPAPGARTTGALSSRNAAVLASGKAGVWDELGLAQLRQVRLGPEIVAIAGVEPGKLRAAVRRHRALMTRSRVGGSSPSAPFQ